MNDRHGMAVFAPHILALGLLVIGFGVSVWLGSIPDELTTAQANLLDTADWIIKVSVGAILGLGASAGLRARDHKGNGARG